MSNTPPDLPPYAHIPGITPHPLSDPRGHSYGHVTNPPIDLEQTFTRAVQLFTHGFFWEAHEAWEQVWIELGRKGLVADYVKGLIKLAASGVKCLEGQPVGAQRHYARAQELLSLANEAGTKQFGQLLPTPQPLIEQIAQRIDSLHQALGQDEKGRP